MVKKELINNIGPLFSFQDQKILSEKTFTILGCGGQGGYVAEYLTRLGVKKIILCDGDFFEASNLNRQHCCLLNTLGKNKAKVVANYCKLISQDVEIIYFEEYFNSNSSLELLEQIASSDFIFDEMDYKDQQKETRELLKSFVLKKIPVTCSGNYLLGSSISIVNFKDIQMFDYFTDILLSGKPNERISQFAATCAITAGLEILSMIKYFTHQKHCPINETFNYDFYHNKIVFKDQFGLYN